MSAIEDKDSKQIGFILLFVLSFAIAVIALFLYMTKTMPGLLVGMIMAPCIGVTVATTLHIPLLKKLLWD